MTDPIYRVYVRDNATFDLTGQVNTLDSLEIHAIANAPGTFAIKMPATCVSAALFLPENTGIFVTRNGAPFFSGPVTKCHWTWETVDSTLEVSGDGDISEMGWRLVYPAATSTTAGTISAAYATANTNAETVIRNYVSNNMGTGAITARQIPYTATANGSRGINVKISARFDSLLKVVQSIIAAEPTLTFSLLQQSSGVLQFDVTSVTDRSASVIFGFGFGNVEKMEYTRERPKADVVVMGGSGSGVSRTFKEKATAAAVSLWGRIEVFKDQRSTADDTELGTGADSVLNTTSQDYHVDAVTRQVPICQYGVDYFLGDKVSVITPNGFKIVEIVRGVDVVYNTTDGELLTAVIAPPGPRHRLKMHKGLAQLKVDSANLDTAQ